MNTFILPIKDTAESITCNIPFSDLLGNGEIIISATVTITVFSGSDPTPSNVLLGAPTTDPTNTILVFTLTGGLAGVTYVVSALVTGSTSNVVEKVGYLTVISPNPF